MILFVGVPFAVMTALLCWEAIQARVRIGHGGPLPPGLNGATLQPSARSDAPGEHPRGAVVVG